MERTYSGEQMVEENDGATARARLHEALVRKWEDDMLAYNMACATFYTSDRPWPTLPEYPFSA